MSSRNRSLSPLVFAACIACTDDNPSHSDDEFGDTGGDTGGATEQMGPSGLNCDENWYSLDGPPVDSSLQLPELIPVEGPASQAQRIEFSGPPPIAGVEVAEPTRAHRPNRPEPLEWKEFIREFARPTAGGWYIEGDLFRTPEQLYGDYLAYLGRAGASEDAKPPTNLLGLNLDGIDDVWSGSRKIALTWCVGWIRPSPDSPYGAELHAERYERMVRAVEESARAWERVTNANFVHLRELDDPTTTTPKGGGCQPGEDGVFFRVRMDVANGCEGPCKGKTNATPRTELDPEWASPENPDGFEREFLMSASSLVSDSEAQITARHELGHVLGFEHEHYREGFPECPAPTSDWRELTPTDPKSVMAYDSCEGVFSSQPRLSAYDRLGGFFRYNWSGRQSRILSAVSQINERSYDGSGRAGIAWHDAPNAALTFWTSTAAPGEQIDFDVVQQCLDGGVAPCNTSEVWSHRVQPSPLFASGTAADLDILLYGPGAQLSDVLLRNDGSMLEAQLVDTDAYPVPTIGAFSNGIDDQVIFYNPGAKPDVLWDPQNDDLIPVDYSDFAYPLPGRYRGFGGGASDILWYQPEDGTIEVWRWLDYGSPYNFLRQGAADASLLGLDAGADYVPLIGDFDGDERTDIFWYAPGETSDALWLSVGNQDVVIFESYPHQVSGQYRSFIGDFDGDGGHDILWYSVADEVEGGVSGIWYFGPDGGHIVRTFSVRGDYTPVVADFDGDGCTDILWYDATSDAPRSPIWRCIPEERDFDCEPPQATPAHAFPIGYGGAF